MPNTRHQTSVNISPETRRQVQELTVLGYGTFTEINRTAIDRLHLAATQPPVTIRHGRLTITVDNIEQARIMLAALTSPEIEDVQPYTAPGRNSFIPPEMLERSNG